jgi:antiviral helicase SKI2
MLIREGTSRGNEPTVQVLEICNNEKRKEDDLLPYLPPFAKYFRALPQNHKKMTLKAALVPLSDIECITRTIITIPEGVQNIHYKKRKHCLALL